MFGLWLEKNTLLLRHSLARPEPRVGESLIKVLLAGICNTDIELIRGYCPFQGVLGHEFVGLVEDGPSQLLGRRVVGEINATCGYCDYCLNGLLSHCADRTVLGIDGRDGAFAEHLVLPSENLHVVPDSMDSSVAIFTEPLAAALEIQEQISVGQGDPRTCGW